MEVGGTLPIRSIRFPSLAQTPWQQISGQALTIVILFAAIVLMARRLAGALLTPLPAAALVVVALACCAAAIVSLFLQSSVRSNGAVYGILPAAVVVGHFASGDWHIALIARKFPVRAGGDVAGDRGYRVLALENSTPVADANSTGRPFGSGPVAVDAAAGGNRG